MGFLSGIISDKLRRTFPKGDPPYTPPRTTAATAKAPKGVKGYKLGGTPGRTYKPK